MNSGVWKPAGDWILVIGLWNAYESRYCWGVAEWSEQAAVPAKLFKKYAVQLTSFAPNQSLFQWLRVTLVLVVQNSMRSDPLPSKPLTD